MRARASLRLATLATCATCAACGGPGLDRSQVSGSPVEDFPIQDVPVHGHPVEISVAEGPDEEGELLAVDSEQVWIENDVGIIRGIPRDRIEYVQVELYEGGDSTALGAWTAVGTLSTLSHGAFLILTGPLWLATGIPATVVEGERNDAEATREGLDTLYQFARFPQGMPPELRASLDPGWTPPPRETPTIPAPVAGGPETGDGLSSPRPPR